MTGGVYDLVCVCVCVCGSVSVRALKEKLLERPDILISVSLHAGRLHRTV